MGKIRQKAEKERSCAGSPFILVEIKPKEVKYIQKGTYKKQTLGKMKVIKIIKISHIID